MGKTINEVNKEHEIDMYFLKYNNLCRKIHVKEIELENAKATKETLSSPNMSEKVSSSSNTKGLDYIIVQIENIELLINKLYDRKQKLRKKYISDFKKLTNDNYEIILTSYYLDKLSIKNMAINMKKSISHVKKLKRDALDELIENIKKIHS